MVTHQQQGLGVARAIQGDVQARQDMEKHLSVSDIGQGKEAIANINKDGRGHGGAFLDQRERDAQQANASEASEPEDGDTGQEKEPRDYRLGKHVDVSG
jgi:hypothetical protein